MAIHIVCGKPGGGKSLYSMYLLIKELRESDRRIVTNLPLRLENLNAWVQAAYPRDNLNIMSRVVLLDEEQTTEFFMHRYESPSEAETALKLPVPHGVAYFLDEAHLHFNARKWAETRQLVGEYGKFRSVGDALLHYLSQHRKLGDAVFAITQAPGNLDKMFRSVAEDYIHVRNEYTAQYFFFRGMGRFVVRQYMKDPTTSNGNDCFSRTHFSFGAKNKAGVGIQDCYDTARGVGVTGSKADIGKRAKGLPIWMVFPIVLAIGSLCVVLPWAFGKVAGAALIRKAKAAEAETAKGILDKEKPVATQSTPTGLLSRGGQVPANNAQPQAVLRQSAAVMVESVARMGPRVYVELTDGTTYNETEVKAIYADGIRLMDGRYFKYKPIGPGHPTPNLSPTLEPYGNHSVSPPPDLVTAALSPAIHNPDSQIISHLPINQQQPSQNIHTNTNFTPNLQQKGK